MFDENQTDHAEARVATSHVLDMADTPNNVIDFPRTGKTPKSRKAPKAKKPKPRKYRLKDLIDEHPTLKSSAKRVGTRTCELFDGKTEECAFASNGWYVDALKISESTLRRAFVELEAAGIMRREINAAKNGQNRVRPIWAVLNAAEAPASDIMDHSSKQEDEPRSAAGRAGEPAATGAEPAATGAAWQSYVTASGMQERPPEVCKDDRGGQSYVTAVVQADYKQEDKPENKEGINTRNVAGAPVPVVRPPDVLERKEEPAPPKLVGSGLYRGQPSCFTTDPENPKREHVPPVEVAEATARIEAEFPGNIKPVPPHRDNNGLVALALKAGWSVEQILDPMPAYACDLHEVGNDTLRLVAYFRREFDLEFKPVQPRPVHYDEKRCGYWEPTAADFAAMDEAVDDYDVCF